MAILKIILQCVGMWILTSFTRWNLDTLDAVSKPTQDYYIPKGLLYQFIYQLSPFLWSSGRILQYFQTIESLPLATNVFCFLIYLLIVLGTIAFLIVYTVLLAPKIEASHEQVPLTLFMNTIAFHLAMIIFYGSTLIEYGITLTHYYLP